MTILAENGPGIEDELGTFTLTGAIDSPLTVPIVLRIIFSLTSYYANQPKLGIEKLKLRSIDQHQGRLWTSTLTPDNSTAIVRQALS